MKFMHKQLKITANNFILAAVRVSQTFLKCRNVHEIEHKSNKSVKQK